MSDLKDYEVDTLPGPGDDYTPRAPGPRTQRVKEQRKSRRKKTFRNILIATVGLAAAVAAAGLVKTIPRLGDPDSAAVPKAPAPTQQTWLLIGTVEAKPAGPADWLAVMSWDDRKDEGLILYLPKTTYVEIPGMGLETMDKALALGREPLLIASVANLLGIQFDHHVVISDQALQAMFEKVGGVEIEVDQKLTVPGADGRVTVLFSEGRQHLTGARVTEFMRYQADGGDEISRGARHSKIWRALFDSFPNGQGTKLSKALGDSTSAFETDADKGQVVSMFDLFASSQPSELTLEILPVKATGVNAGTHLYAPEREKIEAMVADYLSGSRPSGAGKTGRRVEILNGNGRPGIGQEVSSQLIPKGFRIVLNQNAKSFNYTVTQIVVYSDSKAALSIGEEIKNLIGVGEVIISRQQQSVVDVTIVVGKDYLEKVSEG